jgi:hypothetical protein
LAVSIGNAAPTNGTISLSDRQIAIIKSGVMKGLRHPETARFGAIAATKPDGKAIVACGFVDSTNGFGVHSGMVPFEGTLTEATFRVNTMPVVAVHGAYTLARCRRMGLFTSD